VTGQFHQFHYQGLIKSSWIEYIAKAFPRINDQNAKNIVLHLSKHQDRDWTRDELREALNLEMSDQDLEKKLNALVKADIIKKGRSFYLLFSFLYFRLLSLGIS
jgi:DNA-binding HxlR family transcriptional regulator